MGSRRRRSRRRRGAGGVSRVACLPGLVGVGEAGGAEGWYGGENGMLVEARLDGAPAAAPRIEQAVEVAARRKTCCPVSTMR